MFTVRLFSDSEHLGAADRACALCRRLAILHGDGLRILHFSLCSAFHTICLHDSSFLLGICYQQYTISQARVKRETRLKPNLLCTPVGLQHLNQLPQRVFPVLMSTSSDTSTSFPRIRSVDLLITVYRELLTSPPHVSPFRLCYTDNGNN